MNSLEHYYGRLFTSEQLTDALKKQAKALPAMIDHKTHAECCRCGSKVFSNYQLQTGALYCRECLVFGRNINQQSLYYFPQKPFPKEDVLVWKGQLTPYQENISQGMLKAIAAKKDLLVHAVTGAGKTEMIYHAIATVIANGGCVGLASPRIDVCLELYKRLSQDFACKISLLYGGSEKYQRAPLVISTTHQLLKFYQAFDLLIIDEVDAFPFVDNHMLYHAVEQSLKKEGSKIYLTATSTDQLDKQVQSGKLAKLHLPRRFHANPLVVPKNIWLSGVLKHMQKGQLPRAFMKILTKQRQTKYPLLIFFPNIAQGQVFTKILKTYLPHENIAFVSSQTENRLEIVNQFRQQELSILVTTTILERGVTFPCVDVFVMLAHHRLYTKSALVQISGRVGRAKERPTGALLFLHEGITKPMTKAIAEIKEMNKRGGF